MKTINALLEDPPSSPHSGGNQCTTTEAGATSIHDDEVEYWKQKVAQLSAPVVGGNSAPPLGLDSRLYQSVLVQLSLPPPSAHAATGSPLLPRAEPAIHRSPQTQHRPAPQMSRQDLAPSAKLGGPLLGANRIDAEVEYWRRKITELSAPSSAGGGYHSTSLPASLSPSMPRGPGQPPLSRLNLTRPSYKTVP